MANVRYALPILLGCALFSGSARASPGRPQPGDDSEIAAIKAAVERRKTLCSRLVTDRLGRIAAVDDRLRSVIAVNPDALAEARRLDALSRKERAALPLLCTPLLVKDNIDVKGLPTTAGSVALAGNVASSDAVAVAALRRAGAIVIAKTNMSEFAFNYRGRSSVRGQTTSPFSVKESAGGSSSGNGAALAAGLGVVALGTDTSGSLRVPAALTGIVGLRPSFGTITHDGVVTLSSSQDVVGPMCRRVTDCLRVMQILWTTSRHAPAMSPASHPLRGLRAGILRSLLMPGAALAVEEAAIATLQAGGAQIENIALRDVAVLTGQAPPSGETAKFASRSAFDFPIAMDAYLPARPHVPSDTRDLIDTLKALSAKGQTDSKVVQDVETFAANRQGANHDPRHRVNGTFRDHFVAARIDEPFACTPDAPCFDILVYASVQEPAAPVERGPDTGGTHRLAAYSGRPAIAFPIGSVATPHGLRPVALEIMGRPGSDLRLMQIVQAWQARLTLPNMDDCMDGRAILCLRDGSR